MKNLFLIILLSIPLLAQTKPSSYNLADDKDGLYKVNDDNPASNSISDMIVTGDTIWLGTGKGLSYSVDRGNNWINTYQTDAFGTESISALASYNGTIWAGTAHSIDKDNTSLPVGSGLRISTNKGNTWIVVPQPLDNDNDTIEVYGNNRIRALPVTVDVQNLIYDIAFTPNTVWITTFAGGLRKARIDSLLANPNYKFQRVVLPSDDLNSIHPSDTLNFCLQPVAGRFCNENNLNHRVFSVASANDSTIFVGTAGGINKSTDGGISWTKFNHLNQAEAISGNFVVALHYNRTTNMLLAATWKAEDQNEDYAVSYTTNLGENWKITLEGEKAHNFATNSTDIIVPTDNGAFRSNNNGISWINTPTIIDSETKLGLTERQFYSAAYLGNQIWLGSSSGLARFSSDNVVTYTWDGSWKIFFASPKLQSNTETFAFPNPFSPKLDVLKIKYAVSDGQQNVTIRVYDFSMNPVKTIIQNAPRGNNLHVIDQTNSANEGVIDFWDGKDEYGNIVVNGVYFYSVETQSGIQYGKIIVMQ